MWLLWVFLTMVGIGILIGPLVDRLISWYTGKPIPTDETPLEYMARKLRERIRK